MEPREFEPLLRAAKGAAVNFSAGESVHIGGVGAALLTEDGRVFTGACIDCGSGMGFCAEHAAVAEMVKCRVTRIVAAVAVDADGRVLSPCGRCREFMRQINERNLDALVMVNAELVVTLRELLPYPY